jgi:predicted acylesterase/phospholipase RssA
MENIIIGPGGAKGFYLLGAIKYLETKGILYGIKRYIGISIGSLISLLLVCGYTVQEILSSALEFSDIMSHLCWDALKEGGLITNAFVREKLEILVKKKFTKVLTLKELHSVTRKEFISVTLNLTDCVTEYVDHNTFPDLDCISPVLMSINIPFIFKRLTINGKDYIDGALADPFPIQLHNRNTIALLIETPQTESDDIYKYATKVFSCVVTHKQKEKLKLPRYNTKIIRIINDITDSIGIGLTVSKKLEMFFKGYNHICKNYNEEGH